MFSDDRVQAQGNMYLCNEEDWTRNNKGLSLIRTTLFASTRCLEAKAQ
jgi:hypothetical protein